MQVTLYEPALAVGGKAYAGWANQGDTLFFPHVDSCLALLVFGDHAVVGGHLGAQLPGETLDYASAGRYVWSLVVANHSRLNTAAAGCRIALIGDYVSWSRAGVIAEIWQAVDGLGDYGSLAVDCYPGTGVDVTATIDSIQIKRCEGVALRNYALPDIGDFTNETLPKG